jgi:polyisoprenyl-teichoic acid--peptidoglycan teichoic acid transferase
MSTQRAYSSPGPAVEPLKDQQQAVKRSRRRWRVFVWSVILFLLSLATSGAVLIFCPPVLEAMSGMILQPQPGAIQWNGHDRITIAVMGLTSRTPSDPPRTDTLMVMDINPSSHHVTMLSVPRDLWVNLPGYNGTKLASVYTLGGPSLTAYALEKEFRIPIDYTVVQTFWGFTRLIDAMGGVDVNVPQELNDPTYPCLTGTGYCPIDIKPGWHHMDGATALEFVRERHAFAQQDLARVKDQQAFSEAVKRTLMSPSTWLKFPGILNALKYGMTTTLPWNDFPEVGVQYWRAGSSVDHQYINIANGLVQSGVSNDGQNILQPTNPTSLTDLSSRLFADQDLANENASVTVLNGSSTPGAASDAQSLLQGLGFNVPATGNADSAGYQKSQVIINTAAGGSAGYTARRLQRLLNADLVSKAMPGQTAQVVVVLGSNYPG